MRDIADITTKIYDRKMRQRPNEREHHANLTVTGMLLRNVERSRAKKITLADLLVGVPLFLSLAIGMGFGLVEALQTGEIPVGRQRVMLIGEAPGWFAFSVVVHVVMIVLLSLSAILIVRMHWNRFRQRRHQR